MAAAGAPQAGDGDPKADGESTEALRDGDRYDPTEATTVADTKPAA